MQTHCNKAQKKPKTTPIGDDDIGGVAHTALAMRKNMFAPERVAQQSRFESDSKPYLFGNCQLMHRTLRSVLIAAACVSVIVPAAAEAHVRLLFHSFNGSLFAGRYPHTFVELSGTLDADGRMIHENYGYTGDGSAMQALAGPMRGTIHVEEDEYLKNTNIHFAVPITDAQYFAIRQEVERWRKGPESTYNLETHNCVNFVARIAEMVGLNSPVPKNLEKKPKAWLNYLTGLNPQLHAKPIN